MREVVTEKIFSGEEDLIQISTEDRLWDLVEKMKRLEKYIPCVINDVAVIGIDKEQELFLQEQCSNIAVNLHGSPLKVGSIDPYKPENAICIQKDGMFLAYPGEYGYEIRPLISVGYISILKSFWIFFSRSRLSWHYASLWKRKGIRKCLAAYRMPIIMIRS